MEYQFLVSFFFFCLIKLSKVKKTDLLSQLQLDISFTNVTTDLIQSEFLFSLKRKISEFFKYLKNLIGDSIGEDIGLRVII